MSLRTLKVAQRWLVWLIAAHSYFVMVLQTFLPRLTVELGGFGPMEDVFFVRQGGVFHLVVATGYLGEFHRYGTTSLIILAKSVAVVFLTWGLLFLSASPLVVLALVGDAIMGAAVLVLGRWIRHAEGRG